MAHKGPPMNRCQFVLFVAVSCALASVALGAAPAPAPSPWPQWRGPTRDGQVNGAAWPDSLQGSALESLWRITLGPSYSGPVVSDELVFTTETKDKELEVVTAVERQTGKVRWSFQWPGALSVPFFAKSSGDWIRSTPAFDGESLYVAGMRDVLVCLAAKTGGERWRVDFVKEVNSPLPDFGFVCSPLVDGDAVYVQAGASVAKLNKHTGAILWRALENEGGMFGSAFSSPILADVLGQRQLVVQTRQKLAGVDPGTGEVLWSQVVPSFRGMNILTPVVVGDAIFTSSYQNKSWLYRIAREENRFSVTEAWVNKAQGYMSTPVIIGGYAYLHLGNQRFVCINLQDGERMWTSQPFGKYASLIAQGDRILALDQQGVLLLIKANPEKFELLDSRTVSEGETWAHLAIAGDQLFIRELDALTAYRWTSPARP
jgi:outer membrane protein assembly factor BamB